METCPRNCGPWAIYDGTDDLMSLLLLFKAHGIIRRATEYVNKPQVVVLIGVFASDVNMWGLSVIASTLEKPAARCHLYGELRTRGNSVSFCSENEARNHR